MPADQPTGNAFEDWIRQENIGIDLLIEQQFNQALGRWIVLAATDRVRYDPSRRSLTECEPYKSIVEMGEEALPYIREALKADSSGEDGVHTVQTHGLHMAVWEILNGNFQIPEAILGSMQAVQKYTIAWLDQYLDPPHNSEIQS